VKIEANHETKNRKHEWLKLTAIANGERNVGDYAEYSLTQISQKKNR